MPLDPSLLSEPLLSWYRLHGRVLPWRGLTDLYRIWVSEIMLQQTRVDTALRYFDRFLERFPTVQHLAEASEEEVMAAWSGLGFYRRARNMHRCAGEIVEHHGGVLPDDPEVLESLPGIGRYTVGAILSSALNRKLPILDGNVIRVLTRVFTVGGDPQRAAVSRELWRLAEAVLPEDRPGDFNQAIMDLGATVCLPQGPRCDSCPFESLCLARAQGSTEDFPQPGRRTRVVFEDRVSVFLVLPDGRFLLRKRPAGGLLPSLWELPSATLDDPDSAEAVAGDLAPTCALREVGQVEHRFSHRHWSIRVFAGRLDSETQASGPPPGEERWVHPDTFARLEEVGRALGFRHVESGPLVRSSYMAHRAFEL